METVDLGVKQRKNTGKRYSRNLRRNGIIPANIYGHGMKPVSLEVDSRELLRVLQTKAGENVLVNLKVEGLELKESTCLIKDIQTDPVSDKIQHVDFNVVSLTEEIEAHVVVRVKNEENSVGIKAGGVLDIIHHELLIKCVPTALPEAIEIDVTNLDINDSIHVKDLHLPEGVAFADEDMLEEAVVAIHPPRLEEEVEVVAEAEEPGQPEVIEKGKKPEEEEGA